MMKNKVRTVGFSLLGRAREDDGAGVSEVSVVSGQLDEMTRPEGEDNGGNQGQGIIQGRFELGIESVKAVIVDEGASDQDDWYES